MSRTSSQPPLLTSHPAGTFDSPRGFYLTIRSLQYSMAALLYLTELRLPGPSTGRGRLTTGLDLSSHVILRSSILRDDEGSPQFVGSLHWLPLRRNGRDSSAPKGRGPPSKIAPCRSFPRRRESTFWRADVDPRLRGGDDNSDFHFLGWAAGACTLRMTGRMAESLRLSSAC